MIEFKEFANQWSKYNVQPSKKTKHLLFLVVYPDKLSWTFPIEKMTQMTTLLVSGGTTGAGTGHNIQHCLKSEVEQVLTDNTECTHAMIVSVGMIFDMTAPKTQIQHFIDFSNSDKYCKAHIIAFPNRLPYCHDQHIELNLIKWREHNCPTVYTLFEFTERSEENFHDDYTPHWITATRYTVENFAEDERKYKGYAYPVSEERINKSAKVWEAIIDGNPNWFDLVSSKDNYFRHLYARSTQCYYVVNNEYTFIDKIKEKDLEFDLIFTPAAGYIGEMFANELNFNGKVIFYDYFEKNVIAKRNITEMNMTMIEIKTYASFFDHSFDFSGGHTASEKAKDYKDEATLLEYQRNLTEVEYRVMNLLNIDTAQLIEDIKGKTVLFNTSNIFGYHMVHAVYSLDKIDIAYNTIKKLLNTHAKAYVFRGTNPAKKMTIEQCITDI
tara:strand:+ start:12885 stop:14204 length:1320 start_codon:yes stop_codon:yes gene_type:complete